MLQEASLIEVRAALYTRARVKGKSKEVTRKKKPSEGLVFIEREDRELLRNDCFENSRISLMI